MTEETRLRGSATLRRTVNLGNYSSITVEATAQFFQDSRFVHAEIFEAGGEQLSHVFEGGYIGLCPLGLVSRFLSCLGG